MSLSFLMIFKCICWSKYTTANWRITTKHVAKQNTSVCCFTFTFSIENDQDVSNMVGIDIPNNRGENLLHISAQANNHNMLLSICQMGEKHNLTTAINSRFYKKVFFVLLTPSEATNVVYFDQCLGAVHSKRWSKYVFFNFVKAKAQKKFCNKLLAFFYFSSFLRRKVQGWVHVDNAPKPI